MLRASDRRRRWWGIFFLVGAACLLVWGQTVLHGRLNSVDYVYYWLGCISLAAMAFFTAVLDMWVIRRRARATRRELEKRLIETAAQPHVDPQWLKLDED